MEQFLQQIASGLANGAIYACVALALVMIFVSTDHINFAQGELAMFSTYIGWQLMSWGLSFWMAFIVAVAFSFVLGVVIERVILRPLHNAPVLSIVVVFIGLLAIFHSLAGAIWSYMIKEYPSPFPKSDVRHPGFIGPHQIGVVLVTLIVLGLLFAFFRFTPLGLAMRAAAQNPQIGAPGRRPRRLDAGAGLGPRRGDRRGGRHHGGARRLSRAQHDGRHPALRLCRRAGRRHRNPGRRGGRRLHRRRAREPGRLSSATCSRRSTGVYIIGNGEKLTVALIIVISVLTLKPTGLFGRVIVKRV